MKTRQRFINKSIFLLLIICLFFPTISFAMFETEQERLDGASTSRQAVAMGLHDLQSHHGVSSSSSSSSGATFHDEIVFFNVGQGHAALINKVGHVPLLVDAGSTSRPYTAGETYEWAKLDESSLLSQIRNKILGYWRQSQAEPLRGRDYHLNIIITHPDKDHKDFVPAILSKLRLDSQKYQFRFYPHVLLGGTEDHYSGYSLPDCEKRHTSSCLGLRKLKGRTRFLESSGCITHLFCPQGGTDTNRWSVVVRVELEGMSAMLTGDADTYVKSQMLERLGGNGESLISDILLAPHHGSDEHTYLTDWDEAVNPKAIIIGAAPNKGQKGNRHPRGETIYNLLNFSEGRIWQDKVMSHAILYNCNQGKHDEIHTTLFNSRKRLFEVIPNPAAPTAAAANKWHLARVDIPLYTLWTNGTLIFKGDVRTPEFIEAPHGLMGYISVPDPLYLFDSSLRSQLIPPSEKDRRVIYAIIPDLFREKIGVGRRSDKEDASLLTDLAVKEFRHISDSIDRDIYLYALQRMFREKKRIGVWTPHMSSFKWLREAIVERNRLAAKNGERLINAVNFLLSDFARREFMDWDFEGTTLVLKTFLKSHRPLQELNKYIATLSVIEGGVYPKEIEDLCPLGFHEWLQLEKLVSFVRKEIIFPSGEPISVGDVIDILPLRLEGKNFKEIGRFLVKMEGSIDIAQQEAIDSLEQFVTSLRKTISTSAEGRISVARVMDMRQQGKSFREIRQVIVESEGFREDLEKANEIWAAGALSNGVPYVPLTLESFVSFDGHPTTLEEYYKKLEEYFPGAMDEDLS